MVVVYAFFSFFLGQDGLYARKHLEAEQFRLSENYKNLDNTRKYFVMTKESLINDYDTLSLYARQLGYGKKGSEEKVVRIKGLNVTEINYVPPGKIFFAVSPDYVSDTVIKIISGCFGLAVLAFFLVKEFFLSS